MLEDEGQVTKGIAVTMALFIVLALELGDLGLSFIPELGHFQTDIPVMI